MPIAYLAAPDREAELAFELAQAAVRVTHRFGRLLVAERGPVNPAWASNTWFDVEWLRIDSISDAARQLQQRQRNWCFYGFAHHRRGALIQKALPHVSFKPLKFPAAPPSAPLGSYTLLEPGLMLASARCSSPFPNGEVQFEEQTEPPSRAYLKLWEVFTRFERQPGPDQVCLDLGSSPGGWTYVLAKLGASVISVDKAALHPSVVALRNVRYLQQSAFALTPGSLGRIDWLFCDVICYPARLLELVSRWRHSGQVSNFVCTLKFQGETDHDTAARFAEIPGSRLVHLAHNRHELTWCCFGPDPAPRAGS